MSYKSGNNNIDQTLQDLQYCSPFLDVNYDDLFYLILCFVITALPSASRASNSSVENSLTSP